MSTYDVESQNVKQTSGRRVMRYIPEVTADNLPSRIRLEPRYVKKEGNIRNSLLPPGSSSAEAPFLPNAVNRIASGIEFKRD